MLYRKVKLLYFEHLEVGHSEQNIRVMSDFISQGHRGVMIVMDFVTSLALSLDESLPQSPFQVFFS